MATASVNGVGLYYEIAGSGEPLVLVHGSWVDHTSWGRVVPALAEWFRVVVYDRRGHSRSTAPPAQGSVTEDVADLAALIEEVAGSPAHVAANSFGGSIALRLAAARPELFRMLVAHEPPLFGVLLDDKESRLALGRVGERTGRVVERLRAGDMEGARGRSSRRWPSSPAPGRRCRRTGAASSWRTRRRSSTSRTTPSSFASISTHSDAAPCPCS